MISMVRRLQTMPPCWILVASFFLLFISPCKVEAQPKCDDDDDAFYGFKNEIRDRDTGKYELRGIQGFPAAIRGTEQEENVVKTCADLFKAVPWFCTHYGGPYKALMSACNKTCGHGTCNKRSPGQPAGSEVYDTYDSNVEIRDPYAIETHPKGCDEFGTKDEDDWSAEQYNFLYKSCGQFMRHWQFETFCVSAGRKTPLYTSFGTFCPASCGFCVAKDTNEPSTRRNDPESEPEIKLPGWKDKDGKDYKITQGMVAIDNPDLEKVGGTIDVSLEDYKKMDQKKAYPLYFHRKDDTTQIGDGILSSAGRSDWENKYDDSPLWSPNWWIPPHNLDELPSACDMCDCVTAPRVVCCFGLGIDENNVPGMPLTGSCPESDDGVTVCGEKSLKTGRTDTNPYAGFHAAIFDSNQITIITRRFGLNFHREVRRLSFIGNSIVSIEGTSFKHLILVHALFIPLNSLEKIVPGQFMGMASLETLLLGVVPLDEWAADWWYTGIDKYGNYTRGNGLPLYRWHSSPILGDIDRVEEGTCCSEFPQLRNIEFQTTSITEVPENMLHNLKHLASLYMGNQQLTSLPKDFSKDLDSIYNYDISHNMIAEIGERGIPLDLSKVFKYSMAGNPSVCFQGVNLGTGIVDQDNVTCSCGPGYYANDESVCVEAKCPTTITFPTFSNHDYNDGATYGDCGASGDSKDGIKGTKLAIGTTCTVMCAPPYEGRMDFVCDEDAHWKSKSGRVLECMKEHDFRTVYGTPEEKLEFTVPSTVKSVDQFVWDPNLQWDTNTVTPHFGKKHSVSVDAFATMDIVLKCVDGPTKDNGGIQLSKTEEGKASVIFKWKEFEKTGTYLFDGKDDGLTTDKLARKKEIEARCDYDFSAMVRVETGFVTAGGAGLTRGVVRIFTKEGCLDKLNPVTPECSYYDQKFVFSRSFLLRPTLLFPIEDIEGATGGCLNKNFVKESIPFGNEADATCDGNAEDDFRRQGYTQGQGVEMNSTINFVYGGSATYGEYRELKISNGIEARVHFVAGDKDEVFDENGKFFVGTTDLPDDCVRCEASKATTCCNSHGLPKGLYMESNTGKIFGTLGEDGDNLAITVTALAIDDSCNDSPEKCSREQLVAADYTFPAAKKLLEKGQRGLAATVGNMYTGGIPKMTGGRKGLRFVAINSDLFTLPAGLQINKGSGQLTGIPTEATGQEVIVGIMCTDANGFDVGLRTLGITVREAITATWSFKLPDTIMYAQYPEYEVSTVEPLVQPLYRYLKVGRQATATKPYTYITTDDSNSSKAVLARLPAGIKFDGGTGDFYSVPTEAGVFEFYIQATDAKGSTTNVNGSHIEMVVHECTDEYNCNGQGECQYGVDLYDGIFECVCNDDYQDQRGAPTHLFCGQKIDKASRALGIVIALAVIFGIGGVAAYKYRVHVISMRAVDFEAELKKMLESGEIDGDGIGDAGYPREVKRANVTMIEMIGQGQFGEVFKGELDESSSGGVPGYMVAIKTSKDAVGEGADEMVREAAVMAQLNGHKNLVSLIGVVTAGVPLLLLISICENGSLLSYLKQRMLDRKMMSDEEKLGYCQDIACGMAHVASKRFVHRDLAARNILVDQKNIAKVADFGLTRAGAGGDEGGGGKEDYYKSQQGVFPVRWTAPEAMETLRFTTATDVWAWAITVAEIFGDGIRPYDGMNNATVITQVMGGYRHPKPIGCPDPIYGIMLHCWTEDPSGRPTFTQISDEIGTMFDRETLSFGGKMLGSGVTSEDNYNIGGDGAQAVEESSYNIGGDGAATAAPASFIEEESAYNIGGDGAASAIEEESSYNIGGDGSLADVAPAASPAPANIPDFNVLATDDENAYADMGGNDSMQSGYEVPTVVTNESLAQSHVHLTGQADGGDFSVPPVAKQPVLVLETSDALPTALNAAGLLESEDSNNFVGYEI